MLLLYFCHGSKCNHWAIFHRDSERRKRVSEKVNFRDWSLWTFSRYLVNSFIACQFFCQGFLSQTLTIHRTLGEGRGPSFFPLYHFHPLTNMETFICNFSCEIPVLKVIGYFVLNSYNSVWNYFVATLLAQTSPRSVCNF